MNISMENVSGNENQTKTDTGILKEGKLKINSWQYLPSLYDLKQNTFQ